MQLSLLESQIKVMRDSYAAKRDKCSVGLPKNFVNVCVFFVLFSRVNDAQLSELMLPDLNQFEHNKRPRRGERGTGICLFGNHKRKTTEKWEWVWDLGKK